MNEEEFKEKISNQNFHYFKEDKELLKKFTSFLPKDSSIGERRYYFLHNITEIQKCPVCGKKVEYDGRKNRIKVFCSVECYRSAEGNKLTYDKVDEKKKNRFKIRRLTKKEIRQNLKRMRKEYDEKIMKEFYSNLSEDDAKQFLREKINNCGFIWKLKISDIEKGLLKLFTSFLPENSTLAERKFYFENNLNEIQKCIVCGKNIPFRNNERRIKNFCSEKCRVSDEGKISTRRKISKSLKEKEHHFKKEDLKEYKVEITNENRKQLREKLKSKIISFGKLWDRKITKEDYFLLFEFTSFLSDESSISERRWYFINDLNEVQKCPVCGKKLRFLKRKRKLSEFCSDKCRKSNEGRSRILFIQRNNHFKSFMNSLHKRNLKPLFTINEYANAIMNNELKFKCEICNCEFNYIVEKENRINLYNILCPKCFKKTISSGEKEMSEWLKSIGIENIDRNRRSWNIKGRGLEADIFLPDYNLAIEYNGIYWHSNLFKKSNYHLKKHNFFKKLNIDCIQIFENEWLLKKDIVKDIILKKLNKIENRIKADNCSLRELNDEEYESFIEQNWIKGYKEVDVKVGLFYNDELVHCLGLKKDDNEWIIICDCSKLNWIVENGTEKLLNGFKGNMIVKLDKRFCDNIHNNFKFKEYLKPECHYFKNNNLTFLDKIDVLSKKELSKYIKIYDCGYDVYILENH